VAAGDLEPGVYVRVTVRDTGSGMDEATVKRAIEPFFTTKGIGKGTGLGLSMVQGLAAQSGGAMTIESRVGAGTVVSVWLPATDRPPTGQKARSPDTAPSWVEGCRILVVDDDPLVAMGTVAMLEDLGHAPIEASSGRQALKILETTDGIDLVVTDQAMPGMTGTELIAAIRKQRPHLPVILATGWAELPENQPHAFLKLSKPYSQEQLARSIRRCLAQWNATAASEGG
jgi:CheY-like chemotaxis protein